MTSHENSWASTRAWKSDATSKAERGQGVSVLETERGSWRRARASCGKSELAEPINFPPLLQQETCQRSSILSQRGQRDFLTCHVIKGCIDYACRSTQFCASAEGLGRFGSNNNSRTSKNTFLSDLWITHARPGEGSTVLLLNIEAMINTFQSAGECVSCLTTHLC